MACSAMACSASCKLDVEGGIRRLRLLHLHIIMSQEVEGGERLLLMAAYL